MYKVKFDPAGQPLTINITYFGVCTVSYVYTLWEKKSNAKVDEKSGNNQNDEDDNFNLPSPIVHNDGRIIEIFSTMKNPDSQDTEEIVAIQVFQGNIVLACEGKPLERLRGKEYTVTEQETILANKTTLSDPFIMLVV